MAALTAEPELPLEQIETYTTAGRHRREIGSGRITLHLQDLGPREQAVVLVNGYAVPPAGARTVIDVPAGEMRVEVRRGRSRQPSVAQFDLAEGGSVVLRSAPSRVGRSGGRLDVVATRVAGVDISA